MHKGILALAAALWVSGAAQADLKLVQQTSMGGDLGKRVQKEGSAPKTPTMTMYYKGNRTRTETGARVTIFDGQRMLLLNPEKKTYQVIPKDAASKAANPMLAMMDIKADVSVKPTGKTQTIQGKKTQLYVMTMTMKLGMKPGATKDAPKGEMPQIPPITSKMELWTAEFPGISLSGAAMNQAMPAGAASMPFVKDMTEKMKSVKGIPLQTTMTQDIMGRQMSVTMKTTALSEAPLPDSLFGPPAGYKQVPYEAPRMPMMPGAPGQG